jgi:hypothetical protein
MRKILLATLLFVGIAISSYAQSGGDKFSIGVETGLPVGNMSNYYNFVIGGSLKYDMSITKATNFTLSAGYNSFQGKTLGNIDFVSIGYIPVKAGIKYFFDNAFYGEAQVGASFQTQYGGGTAFAYSPGFGFKFSDKVDLGIRYEAWSNKGTVSQISARLAYSF